MNMQKTYTITLRGRLFSLAVPQVMGILNATPDSFFDGSRMLTDDAGESLENMRQRVRQIIQEGGTMIDVGACSTRPGSVAPDPDEEKRRIALALQACREEAPDCPVSVDTYRADVAAYAIEECGAHIINDISGGEMDSDMFRTVARLRVPYILMHMQGTPENMQADPQYGDVTRDVITYLARRAQRLREMGVADIIADPGFGFGKTIEQNYQMMRQLRCFHELQMPLLVGISRKSMIYRLLDPLPGGEPASPVEALAGTESLHTWAALQGCHILRVHDVRPAVDVLRVTRALFPDGSNEAR